MKALKPFGLFGGNESTTADAPEDGRVVELFRSRAELRKQHEELGQELQRLRAHAQTTQEVASDLVRLSTTLGRIAGRLESAEPAVPGTASALEEAA